MSQATQSNANSSKMLRAMVGLGVLCGLLIAVTFEGTQPRIERLKAEALEKAIFKVIPGINQTRAFQLDDTGNFSEAADDKKSKTVVYAGYDAKDSLIGIAIEASGQGYADIIRVLYGYDPKAQQIIGFYVLESKETPGLGDKIEKDDRFLANFSEMDVALLEDLKTLKNQIMTVKSGNKENSWEVDGITGATISSRAIGSILASSTQTMLPLIYKNKESFNLIRKEEGNE